MKVLILKSLKNSYSKLIHSMKTLYFIRSLSVNIIFIIDNLSIIKIKLNQQRDDIITFIVVV